MSKYNSDTLIKTIHNVFSNIYNIQKNANI